MSEDLKQVRVDLEHAGAQNACLVSDLTWTNLVTKSQQIIRVENKRFFHSLSCFMYVTTRATL